MYVTKLTFVEIADLEDQYRRPYELSLDGQTLHRLEQSIREEGGSARPALLADVLGQGLEMSSTDIEHVALDGSGWRHARYRYVMEVQVEAVGRYSSGHRVIVCGYTDRCDKSANYMAPDLRMYVNSIVGIRDVERKDNRGNAYIQSTVIDNYQVLLGEFSGFQHNRGGENEYMMRPSDVFGTIEKIRELGDDGEFKADTRNMFINGVATNRRRNNQRARYMSTLIESDRSGQAEMETYYDDITGGASRNVAASDVATEPRFIMNRFMEQLTQRCNVIQDRWFEYKDLIDFTGRRNMSDLDDVTHFADRCDNDLSVESQSWRGANVETTIACTLCQEVPAIMVDCLLSTVTFTCSNMHSPDGSVEFLASDWAMFVAGDFKMAVIDAFKSRFITEVFNMISRNNVMGVDLDVTADVGGLTTIEISVDGKPWERFAFPSFCDSMISPTVTRDMYRVDDLAKKYELVRKEVVNPMILDINGDPLRESSHSIDTGRPAPKIQLF